MLFNEYLLLQILILVSLFFLFWTSDTFTTVLIGVSYLLLMSLMSLYLDSDLLISFLIIIDLGVFFVMFSFILHLTKFLVTKFNYNYSYKNIFFAVFTTLFILGFLFLINVSMNSNFNLVIEYVWFMFVSYYNYYNLNSIIFNSDMQTLKELYFHINNLEFFVISIFIYVGLVLAVSIFGLAKKVILKNHTKLINNLSDSNQSASSFYFKIQNMMNQITVPASSKIWIKK